MKILLVGYSNIATRRVLPAIDQLNLERIDIATSRPDAVDTASLKTPVKIFKGYHTGIQESDAELCYISTVNSAHFPQACLALESGKHTLVDKPIALHKSDVDKLLLLSRKKNRLLSEAVVYLYHRRLADLRVKMQQAAFEPRHINAVFAMPPFPDDSYRYNLEISGGISREMGAYMVTPLRLFFGLEPLHINVWPTELRYKVPVGLRISMLFEQGKTFSGYYSFDSEYQNTISIYGENFAMYMERFFTTTPTLETSINIRNSNKDLKWTYPPDDSFLSYLQSMLSSLNDEDRREKERQNILHDHIMLHRIEKSLKENL